MQGAPSKTLSVAIIFSRILGLLIYGAAFFCPPSARLPCPAATHRM